MRSKICKRLRIAPDKNQLHRIAVSAVLVPIVQAYMDNCVRMFNHLRAERRRGYSPSDELAAHTANGWRPVVLSAAGVAALPGLLREASRHPTKTDAQQYPTRHCPWMTEGDVQVMTSDLPPLPVPSGGLGTHTADLAAIQWDATPRPPGTALVGVRDAVTPAVPVEDRVRCMVDVVQRLTVHRVPDIARDVYGLPA